MAEIINLRLENENDISVKIISAVDKNIKMLNFLCSAYSYVKTKYKQDCNYYADYCLGRPGVYILVNDDDKTIYIGQSDNLLKRLNTHYSKQAQCEYWVNTYVFTTDSSQMLNITQLKYIESKLIEIAQTTSKMTVGSGNIMELKNLQNAKCPNINTNDVISSEKFIQNVLLLTKAIGVGYFDKKEILNKAQNQSEIFIFKTSKSDAKMMIEGDSYVVLKDSKIRIDTTSSCDGHIKDKRQILINNHKLIEEGDFLIATDDLTFDSPSTAADVVGGASLNGRTCWKNQDGKTLKDIQIAKEN